MKHIIILCFLLIKTFGNCELPVYKLNFDFNETKSDLAIIRDYAEKNKDIPKNSDLILGTIMTEAEKYDISPYILYAIFWQESRFKAHIEHPFIYVKGKRTRAVGLGGVVWEWWDEKLIKNDIADVRADLFDPETNIRASAFILNEFRKMKQLQGTQNKLESALARYYGSVKSGYHKKIIKIANKIENQN